MRKRSGLRGVAVGGALAIWAAAGTAVAAPVTITILQTNDLDRIEEDEGRGGYARLAGVLEREGAAADDVLVVHAGDAFSPSLLAGFDKGAHMVDLLNRLPLDVFVMGNHEFDFGPDVAKERLKEARFPVLNANVTEADGAPFAGLPPSRMVEVEGFRLGFFGITTPDTVELASPGYARFLPVMATAERESARLREAGADLVIAVTHTGLGDDLQLWRSGLVDLVLTGHDHDLMMLYDGSAAMMESASQADYVTAMTLTLERVEDDGATEVVWRPAFRAIDTAAVEPSAAAAAEVKRYTDRLSKELDIAVGRTSSELDSRRATIRGQEAAIGNLIADAMRAAVGADLAITNGGGIRANKLYPAGTTLTRRDILSELPFGNKTVKLETPGTLIKEALENGLSQAEQGGGRFPQVSGMTVTFDLNAPPGARVAAVTVAGQPLDPARIYTLATNDYMARGGDGYAMLGEAKPLIDPAASILMASQVIDYIAARGEVAPAVEGRIKRVE